MSYLVLSRKHGLHHLAHWLSVEKGEGAVQLASLRPNYQRRAWEGLHERTRLPLRKKGQSEAEWAEGLPEHELLITDDTRLSAAATGPCLGALPAPRLPLAALALGGWWDGERLLTPHWVVRDMGLWPGGMGPAKLGGVTLVRGGSLLDQRAPELLSAARTTLEGCRGLLALDLEWDAAEEGWRAGALRAGWPELHAQLWLWAQPSALEAISGRPAPMPMFAVGAPLSAPPYPHAASDLQSRPIHAEGDPFKHLVLFDAQKREGQLQTAALDGLVGLVCGSGQTLARAKQQAALAAAQLRWDEMQGRLDTGMLAEQIVCKLEDTGWL